MCRVPFAAGSAQVLRGPVLRRTISHARSSLPGSRLGREGPSFPAKGTGPMAPCEFCKETIKNLFYLIHFCQLQLPAVGGVCAFVPDELLQEPARLGVIFLTHYFQIFKHRFKLEDTRSQGGTSAPKPSLGDRHKAAGLARSLWPSRCQAGNDDVYHPACTQGMPR